MTISIREKKEVIKKACERLHIETDFDLDVVSTDDLNELWRRATRIETYYLSFLKVSKGLDDIFKEY